MALRPSLSAWVAIVGGSYKLFYGAFLSPTPETKKPQGHTNLTLRLRHLNKDLTAVFIDLNYKQLCLNYNQFCL
jgi:hypothetical protein